MEDAFRFALMALFEANLAICWADPRLGRGSQHTILEVPALLALRGFRRRVLKQVSDPSIRQWFDDYFDALDTRLTTTDLQTEIRYRQNGEEVLVRTDEPTRVLAELTAAAVARGEELEGLQVRRPSLEEVYLALTAEGDAETETEVEA